MHHTSVTKEAFGITGEDYRHIIKVMRMKEDDQIICVAEDHKAALCMITNISDEIVTAQVVQWLEESVELPVEVSIVSGLPKGDKLESDHSKGNRIRCT